MQFVLWYSSSGSYTRDYENALYIKTKANTFLDKCMAFHNIVCTLTEINLVKLYDQVQKSIYSGKC